MAQNNDGESGAVLGKFELGWLAALLRKSLFLSFLDVTGVWRRFEMSVLDFFFQLMTKIFFKFDLKIL